METQTATSDPAQVAACGLYCGACRKFTQGTCAGCRGNEKASWCKIRRCCIDHGYQSCADCTILPLGDCKTFNNLPGKIFALLFKSDRGACIARIRTVGYENFANEMHLAGIMTLRKGGK